MPDAYSVLGIQPGSDEETIKKAYRQKCKQYHPDLHPDDPGAEEKFKEVQAAYSEIMRQRSGGASASGGYGSYGSAQRQPGSRPGQQQYEDPFGFGGFGFGPFGFGFYSSGGYNAGSYSNQQEGPELQAAGNYIRNGYYEEALRVLGSIPEAQRSARWHYYAALANSGLGNNIRAQSEARTAVEMEPGNYQYQNLLNRLQNYGADYSARQRQHAQPGGSMCHFCITLWMAQMLCSLMNLCCCRPF